MSVLPASLVPLLGWSLIAFLWQGALVGLAAAIALMLLRNARPQARYAVCCAALALCLVLPVAGVLRGWNAAPDTDVSPTSRFVQLAPAADHPVVIAAPAAWSSNLQVDLPMIVALWSIGAALLAARMAMGMMWVARVGRDEGLAHPRWQRRLDRLADRIGVECRVRLHVVAELTTPVAAGCWKPVVLVPAALIARLPIDLVEALLAHELAHVRRHDYLVNLLQSAIEALLFYHPVVWWLSKRIRIEREQIADDLAARALGDPQRLALALRELDLFQEALHRADVRDGFISAPSLIPAANGGHLMSRIQRLIRPNQHALSWKIALPIIGLTAACLTVYAHDAAPSPAATAPSVPAVATAPVVSTDAIAATASARAVRAALATAPAIATRAAALAVATAATAAKEATRAVRIANASDAHTDAFAIVHGDRDGIQMSGDSRDIPQIEQARKRVHGDFIWTRHGGRTYIVQDPALVAQAEQAMKPNEAIDRQMEALDAQMKVPEQKMEELSRQMEKLSDDHSPANLAMEKYDGQMEALDRQIEAISHKMEAVGEKMEQAGDKQRDVLQRELEVLHAKVDPLNAQMQALSAAMQQQGKQIEANEAPIEQLGKQMEAESKPMEELGKQMEALGRQEEQISKEVDRTVHDLIEQAVRAGKAVPAGNMRQ